MGTVYFQIRGQNEPHSGDSRTSKTSRRLQCDGYNFQTHPAYKLADFFWQNKARWRKRGKVDGFNAKNEILATENKLNFAFR
jgi:hypothetical protein